MRFWIDAVIRDRWLAGFPSCWMAIAGWFASAQKPDFSALQYPA